MATVVPLFSDQCMSELRGLARSARGGAILLTPAGDVALASGLVTDDARRLAKENAAKASARSQSLRDLGSSVYLLAVGNGWTLAVQTRGKPPRLAWLTTRIRAVRDNLSLWLSLTHLPPAPRGPGSSGAPAEVFAEQLRKRRS